MRQSSFVALLQCVCVYVCVFVCVCVCLCVCALAVVGGTIFNSEIKRDSFFAGISNVLKASAISGHLFIKEAKKAQKIN